jgi:hypothetical protein
MLTCPGRQRPRAGHQAVFLRAVVRAAKAEGELATCGPRAPATPGAP